MGNRIRKAMRRYRAPAAIYRPSGSLQARPLDGARFRKGFIDKSKLSRELQNAEPLNVNTLLTQNTDSVTLNYTRPLPNRNEGARNAQKNCHKWSATGVELE